MGAWDTGPFDNDGAMHWVADLERDGTGAVRAALSRALDEGYIDATTGEEAVAAAEVVAASHGAPRSDLPPAVRGWIDAHGGDVGEGLVATARTAVERIAGADSDLAELWDETGDDDWRTATEDLAARLAVAAP